jgi:hypothetical protein
MSCHYSSPCAFQGRKFRCSLQLLDAITLVSSRRDGRGCARISLKEEGWMKPDRERKEE